MLTLIALLLAVLVSVAVFGSARDVGAFLCWLLQAGFTIVVFVVCLLVLALR